MSSSSSSSATANGTRRISAEPSLVSRNNDGGSVRLNRDGDFAPPYRTFQADNSRHVSGLPVGEFGYDRSMGRRGRYMALRELAELLSCASGYGGGMFSDATPVPALNDATAKRQGKQTVSTAFRSDAFFLFAHPAEFWLYGTSSLAWLEDLLLPATRCRVVDSNKNVALACAIRAMLSNAEQLPCGHAVSNGWTSTVEFEGKTHSIGLYYKLQFLYFVWLSPTGVEVDRFSTATIDVLAFRRASDEESSEREHFFPPRSDLRTCWRGKNFRETLLEPGVATSFLLDKLIRSPGEQGCVNKNVLSEHDRTWLGVVFPHPRHLIAHPSRRLPLHRSLTGGGSETTDFAKTFSADVRHTRLCVFLFAVLWAQRESATSVNPCGWGSYDMDRTLGMLRMAMTCMSVFGRESLPTARNACCHALGFNAFENPGKCTAECAEHVGQPLRRVTWIMGYLERIFPGFLAANNNGGARDVLPRPFRAIATLVDGGVLEPREIGRLHPMLTVDPTSKRHAYFDALVSLGTDLMDADMLSQAGSLVSCVFRCMQCRVIESEEQLAHFFLDSYDLPRYEYWSRLDKRNSAITKAFIQEPKENGELWATDPGITLSRTRHSVFIACPDACALDMMQCAVHTANLFLPPDLGEANVFDVNGGVLAVARTKDAWVLVQIFVLCRAVCTGDRTEVCHALGASQPSLVLSHMFAQLSSERARCFGMLMALAAVTDAGATWDMIDTFVTTLPSRWTPVDKKVARMSHLFRSVDQLHSFFFQQCTGTVDPESRVNTPYVTGFYFHRSSNTLMYTNDEDINSRTRFFVNSFANLLFSVGRACTGDEMGTEDSDDDSGSDSESDAKRSSRKRQRTMCTPATAFVPESRPVLHATRKSIHESKCSFAPRRRMLGFSRPNCATPLAARAADSAWCLETVNETVCYIAEHSLIDSLMNEKLLRGEDVGDWRLDEAVSTRMGLKANGYANGHADGRTVLHSRAEVEKLASLSLVTAYNPERVLMLFPGLMGRARVDERTSWWDVLFARYPVHGGMHEPHIERVWARTALVPLAVCGSARSSVWLNRRLMSSIRLSRRLHGEWFNRSEWAKRNAEHVGTEVTTCDRDDKPPLTVRIGTGSPWARANVMGEDGGLGTSGPVRPVPDSIRVAETPVRQDPYAEGPLAGLADYEPKYVLGA